MLPGAGSTADDGDQSMSCALIAAPLIRAGANEEYRRAGGEAAARVGQARQAHGSTRQRVRGCESILYVAVVVLGSCLKVTGDG